MNGSYLAILGRRRDGIEQSLHGLRQIVEVANSERLLILVSHGLEVQQRNGAAIIGPIYLRNGGNGYQLEDADWRSIGASRGRHLCENFFGSYVAFWEDQNSLALHAVRAPLGEIGCYLIKDKDVLFLSNDVHLLTQFVRTRAQIDWQMIATHLSFGHFRSIRTALRNLDEVVGGSRVTFDGKIATLDPLWSPWSFTDRAVTVADRKEASLLVEETAAMCVKSLASRYKRVLLGISGGLDSSIVAACLSRCSIDTVHFTLVTPDPAGDERHHAIPLAQYLNAPLVELVEDPGLVDVERSDAGHLPRPVARAFSQSADRLQQRLAEHTGADAYFTGAGGDNVFAYIPSVSPVSDRLLSHGLKSSVATARDISRMTGSSLSIVMRGAMRRAWFREPTYHWPKLQTYLTPEAASRVGETATHPWLDAPAGSLPGKAAHVAWLLGIQNNLEGFDRELTRPIVSPLMAQPLVEACLRIPTWMWCLGGRNRAVAREAFANCLPATILDRNSKGSPDGFVIAVFEAHRQKIREMLLDGVLIQNGVLDRDGIEAALNKSTVVADHNRLMAFVDVEAWASTWAGR